MPWLGRRKQGGADVAAAQEHHGINVAHDNVGILLQQDAIPVQVLGLNFGPVIVKARRPHLRQDHGLAPGGLDGLNGPVEVAGFLLPCNPYSDLCCLICCPPVDGGAHDKRYGNQENLKAAVHIHQCFMCP